MIEFKRVGDIVESFSINSDKETKPKEIIFELSECKTYYNCQMYFDAMKDGEIREIIITLKAREPNYAYDFCITSDDNDKTIFTVTIPDTNS